MTKGEFKAPSQRQLRVGEELRHALAWIIERGELRDPELSRVSVTVTEVRVSPDLRNATAFVTPLGGGEAAPILEALTRARSFLRHRIGQEVRLRTVPNLSFQADTSFDQASRIEDLLHDPRVARDLQDNDDGEEPDDGT